MGYKYSTSIRSAFEMTLIQVWSNESTLNWIQFEQSTTQLNGESLQKMYLSLAHSQGYQVVFSFLFFSFQFMIDSLQFIFLFSTMKRFVGFVAVQTVLCMNAFFHSILLTVGAILFLAIASRHSQ